MGLGFAKGNDEGSNYERMKSKVEDGLKKHFRPEFLNRIDDIIVFHQLTEEQIITMVDLMITRVESQLAGKDMAIELTPAAKALLARRGFDPVLGARRCAGRSSARSRTSCRRRSSLARSSPARSSSWTSRASSTRTCPRARGPLTIRPASPSAVSRSRPSRSPPAGPAGVVKGAC